VFFWLRIIGEICTLTENETRAQADCQTRGMQTAKNRKNNKPEKYLK